MWKNLEKRIKIKWENSLILIDKKGGITSHDEVYNLRRIFHIKKIGHSGTLDPKVTGLLVMGLGKATKILEYMLLSEKVYEAEFIFHQKISRDKFEEVRKKFLGKISQLPPVKSSVKREWREREIYNLEILDYDKNERWVKLKTAVERGTYIRKLAHDMGEEIGIRIHMGDLRRIQVGVFTEKDNFISSEKLAEKIEDFFRQKCPLKKILLYFQLKKYFYPMEEFFKREKKFEKIFIKKEAKKYILAGNPIRWKNVKNKNINFKKDLFVVFQKKELLSIAEKIDFKNREAETEIFKIKKKLI